MSIHDALNSTNIMQHVCAAKEILGPQRVLEFIHHHHVYRSSDTYVHLFLSIQMGDAGAQRRNRQAVGRTMDSLRRRRRDDGKRGDLAWHKNAGWSRKRGWGAGRGWRRRDGGIRHAEVRKGNHLF